jgi:hypothetical protein
MAVWYVRCLITLTVACIRSQSDVAGGPSRAWSVNEMKPPPGWSALPQCARGRVVRGINGILHWKGRRSSPTGLSFRSCDIDAPAGRVERVHLRSRLCLFGPQSTRAQGPTHDARGTWRVILKKLPTVSTTRYIKHISSY